jgi:predicted phage tail protein
MITIKYKPNRFEETGVEIVTLDYNRDKTLNDYIKESGFPCDDKDYIVTGVNINSLEKRLDNFDEIIITPRVNFAAIAIWWAAATFWQGVALVATVLLTAYSIYSAVTSRPRQPSFGTATATPDSMDSSSPTYGWEGIQNQMAAGVPIPVVYGRHRVGGNIINQYVRADGDKQYLNMLIALSEGEINSISSIEVNDNPSGNFSGITLTINRLGTNSQSIIPNFQDLHHNYAVAANLTKNNSYVYTMTNTDAQAFELKLNIPAGLYQQDETTGSLSAWSITYRVEYKLHAAGSYTDLGTTTISDKSRNTLYRIYRKDGLAAGQYDIRITRTSDDSSLSPLMQGDLQLVQVDEITTEDLAYPNVALLGIEALATDQISGSAPNVTAVVEGRKVSIPAVRYSGAAINWEDYYWDPINSVFKRFSDNAECTWDGTTYENVWSANPVWCVRDLLTNTRYGLGGFIDTSLITAADWISMAKYCEEKVSDGASGYEKRFRLDVVLDSACRSMDLLMQLCSTFRAFVFYSNGVVKISIDKAATPVQMFGMGNIIESSFVQSWKSLKERYNTIDVQFNDEDKNYAMETITVIDEVAYAAGDPIRKRDLRLFCTRASQAVREGKYMMLIAKYIDRTVKLKAGIDAIACQVGDIINVSHDVPQWGFSGRVITDASNSVSHVHIDQPVTIEGGKTYKLRVRFADDTQEEKTVSNTAGTYSYLNVSSNFSQVPAAYDLYAFGEDTKVVYPYRLVGIRRANNEEVELDAIEYDANIYDTDTISIPDTNYSALSTTVPLVQNLELTEGSAILSDGTVKSSIEVWFQRPVDAVNVNKYQSAKIYLSDDAGASYKLVGQTEGVYYEIKSDFEKTATYYVKVLTVCANGIEDKLSNAPSDSIVIAGRTSTPAAVTNFGYTWGDVLLLVWSPNTELDLAGYEIRDETGNWGVDNSHLIYKGDACRKTLYPTARTVGTYYIRAYNRSGVYSTTSGSITPALTAPSAPSGLGYDVLFNVARFYWTDTGGTNLLYYEVYRSETNAWAGEETLVGKVSGKSIELVSKSPRQGQAQSATGTTLVDSSLIGLGDGFFTGDTITITSGTGNGQTRTITGFTDATGTITTATWTTTPDSTSKYIVTDNTYLKVRGVDQYGVGTFSAAQLIEYNNITENMFGDNVVTARKIYVACLSAISANVGCLTAGTIQGVTIQTGSGGARTVMSASEFRSYDAGCNIMFEVKDGCVQGRTLKLIDPACDCCYSYLSSGQWYFHDELGNSNPYIKRIKSGEANTGSKVDLCGWKSQPEVMIGIKELLSYNADYSVNCQRWCVYYDCMTSYCTSSTCYGYCFCIHAKLIKSAGIYAECIQDASCDTSVYTHSDACSSIVRNKFQLWCFCSSCCDCYYYGQVCYRLKYKCCCAGCAWTCCDYLYCHQHNNIGELKSDAYACQTLTFGAAGCWELQLNCLSLAWCLTNLSGVSTGCCCRQITDGALNSGSCLMACRTGWNASYAITIGGSNPTGSIFCTYVCVSYCYCNYISNNDGAITYVYNCLCLCQCNLLSVLNYSNNADGTWCYGTASVCCSINSACCTLNNCCLNEVTSAYNGNYSHSRTACAWHCLLSGYMVQCYTNMDSNTSCDVKKLYGTKDYSSAETVLDSTGVLSWLAIGYN